MLGRQQHQQSHSMAALVVTVLVLTICNLVASRHIPAASQQIRAFTDNHAAIMESQFEAGATATAAAALNANQEWLDAVADAQVAEFEAASGEVHMQLAVTKAFTDLMLEEGATAMQVDSLAQRQAAVPGSILNMAEPASLEETTENAAVDQQQHSRAGTGPIEDSQAAFGNSMDANSGSDGSKDGGMPLQEE